MKTKGGHYSRNRKNRNSRVKDQETVSKAPGRNICGTYKIVDNLDCLKTSILLGIHPKNGFNISDTTNFNLQCTKIVFKSHTGIYMKCEKCLSESQLRIYWLWEGVQSCEPPESNICWLGLDDKCINIITNILAPNCQS